MLRLLDCCEDDAKLGLSRHKLAQMAGISENVLRNLKPPE